MVQNEEKANTPSSEATKILSVHSEGHRDYFPIFVARWNTFGGREIVLPYFLADPYNLVHFSFSPSVMNTGVVVVLLSLGVVCVVLGLLLLSLRRDNARLSDERAAADEARRLAEAVSYTHLN